MLNYSSFYKDKESRSTFIRNFKMIGNDIKLYLGNGETTIIPANKNNLEMIREKMIKQGIEADERLLPVMKKVNVACKILTVVGVTSALVVAPGIGTVIAGGITLLSGSGCITTNKIIEDIKKVNTFIRHKKRINQAIIKNPYILKNIGENDYAQIQDYLLEDTTEPIVIENLDKLSYQAIRIIWNNIKVSKNLNVDYKYDYQYQKRRASY